MTCNSKAEYATGIRGTVRLEGVVEHGDARGRELGYPTANLTVPDGEIRDGVWAGTVRLRSEGEDGAYVAAVSIGRRPTYYRNGTRLLEAHLLDYAGDLYGRTVEVTLYSHIRTQRRFHGPDELAAQIRDDVAQVRSWAAGAAESMDVKDRTVETAAALGTIKPQTVPATPGQLPRAPAGPAASVPESLERSKRATPREQVEWSTLINALVEVRHNGRVIRTGFVEDAMPDSSVLWIAADANDPRQMFDASQGLQVWVAPRELPGALRYRMTADHVFKASPIRNL
ncbi:hypothetical protein StoSoilA2_20000 [Arthrobacter sp. StoSoilA2]|uniref:riboflavin kinase n=1 Tax=Arthrobacter sp. StoSoilA2 TaxID=2830990 RepID=UPI001CC548BE|nr:riboflavin kinase [Arthrobacter sp. StoSoilA2]BCW35944.1 hypothetical protein StoSoilA2_20000 [Arthrobacter sp. StoSoilA2]